MILESARKSGVVQLSASYLHSISETKASMTENVLQVLTYKSVESMIAAGGTSSWPVDRRRARGCKYVVCCRNAHALGVEGPEAHGSAFLVGRISGVEPSPDTPARWIVLFSEYAIIDVPNRWEGRIPVRFFTVDDYGDIIHFESLKWQPVPFPIKTIAAQISGGLTIAEAKAGLAETFGVAPSAIKITIER